MRTVGPLIRSEFRLFFRDPAAWFWTLLFPVVLIAVLGALTAPPDAVVGTRFIDGFTPVVLIMSFTMLALFITPGSLVGYREKGILRRLSTTPVGPGRLLGAQLLVNLTVAVATTVLVLGVASALWGVVLPGQLGGLLLAFAFSVTALLALGLLLAAVVPSSKAVSGIAAMLFFPLMLFAGLYVPREALPAAMNTIGGFTPVGAAVSAFADAAATGWPGVLPLAVLAVWSAVLGLAGARLFRWA